jgi:hypothetical protein
MSTLHRWDGGVGSRERGGSLRVAVAVAIGAMIVAAGVAPGAAPPRPNVKLEPVGRTVAQDQGAWVVDYRLRLAGPAGVVIAPEEIGAKVDGWVSNSRVASHAVPRWSSLGIAHGPDFAAVGEVIAAADEAHRCREKLIVRVWGEDQCPCRAGSCGPASDKDKPKEKSAGAVHEPVPGPAGPTAGLPMSLAPGGIVHVRLRLEHQHVLFGDYDPLLGVRAVEIALAGATVRDRVPLDREQYLAQPRFSWPEPPEERRDTRHSVTGPDSLHLEAHVPGHHYYRYPDRPVRYGTPMRLRFSYLIAAGTEGECRVRVAQYKDTPTSWRMLNDAGFEKCLKVVGRWTRVERVFTTHAEATTLALDFRIAGDTDIGEMWIDDVSLEPVGCPGHTGP